MATSCCTQFARRLVHVMFAILVVVFVGCYVVARYAGECDMDCEEGTKGAVDAGDGLYQCGDKKSCGKPTRAGIYASAAAICVTVLLWIVWTIRVCITARKERKEALAATGDNSKQGVDMKQAPAGMGGSDMKSGHLVAGGESAV